MGKIINFTNSLIAAGAVMGAAAGVGAVWEYEESFEPAHADALAPVVRDHEEFHFWEDASPEIGAAVFGGLIGAVAVGGMAYGMTPRPRQARSDRV